MKEVNERIIPSLGLDLGKEKISESTARRWLLKLGYEMKECRKGMYVDGHEREDVVNYRKTFLTEVEAGERSVHSMRNGKPDTQLIIRFRVTYTDDTLEPVEPKLAPGERRRRPLFHDETIVSTNDLRRRVWVRDGKMPLRKKGQGRAIHISDFIAEETGRLRLSEDQLTANSALPPCERLKCVDAREIMYPGKNHEGWWNMEKLVAQVSTPESSTRYTNANH